MKECKENYNKMDEIVKKEFTEMQEYIMKKH